MKQQDNFEDFLARQLKANQPYIADEGFSGQVMQALPLSKPSGTALGPAISSIAILLIALIAISQLPLLESFAQLWQWSSKADLITLLKAGGAVSGGILLVCFGWLAREMNLV